MLILKTPWFNKCCWTLVLFLGCYIKLSASLSRYQLQRIPEAFSRLHANPRHRLLSDGTYEYIPLAKGLGTHFAWIYVGSPPQRSSVIVDTGSHLMAFPCARCATCGEHTDPGFDIQLSKSAEMSSCASMTFMKCNRPCGKNDECIISQWYTEGSSWTARVVNDYVWLGPQTLWPSKNLNETYGHRFDFGCEIDETGLFRTQIANGIIGLADEDHTLVPILHQSGKIQKRLFSLCFAHDGGSMVIGDVDTNMHLSPVIPYAELLPKANNGWFTVHVKDIRINGKSIDVPEQDFNHGKGFIVDSGTTDTFFPSRIRDQFMSTYQQVTGLRYQTNAAGCIGYTQQQLDVLPSIQIVLRGFNGSEDVIVDIPASQYLDKGSSNGLCSSIYLTERDGGVLGGNVMRNFDVIFDSSLKRVGFVRANCTYDPEDGANNNAILDITKLPLPLSTVSPSSSSLNVSLDNNNNNDNNNDNNDNNNNNNNNISFVNETNSDRVKEEENEPLPNSLPNTTEKVTLDDKTVIPLNKTDDSPSPITSFNSFQDPFKWIIGVGLIGALITIVFFIERRRRNRNGWQPVPAAGNAAGGNEEDCEFGLVDAAEEEAQRPAVYHDQRPVAATPRIDSEEYLFDQEVEDSIIPSELINKEDLDRL